MVLLLSLTLSCENLEISKEHNCLGLFMTDINLFSAILRKSAIISLAVLRGSFGLKQREQQIAWELSGH